MGLVGKAYLPPLGEAVQEAVAGHEAQETIRHNFACCQDSFSNGVLRMTQQ